MDLLEHEGKDLFRRWGLPTPDGRTADSPEEAAEAARALGPRVAIKAQVRIGGRGKAGGVVVVDDPESARREAARILKLRISGHSVSRVLVEAGVDIAREAYLSILLDRGRRRHVIVASARGGVDIEAVAAESPHEVVRVPVDPLLGLQRFQVARVVAHLGLPAAAAPAAAGIVRDLYRRYVESDATLVEVNPLAVDRAGHLVLLDAKVSLDDSAAFRHPELESYQAPPEDDLERQAAAAGLANFVKLDGDVGIVGNGAGLVMSTLDLVDQVGGRAANFLDVGGGADAATLSRALRLVLADGRARSVVVNIFGGITRCDLVAEGVIDALKEVAAGVPVVVRLAGTNADAGRRILEEGGLPTLVSAETMLEAATRAVEAAR